MNINKLDLLSRGWKPSEVEAASKILEEAENDKQPRTKILDQLLFIVLGILMLGNGFVCSALLVPFIYASQTSLVLMLAAVVGVVFSALFTIVIFDIEKIHKKHETNLFIAFIVNGIVNFYLILEFTAQFSIRTKLAPTQNIYLIAAIYLIAFLAPHIIYQMRKKRET